MDPLFRKSQQPLPIPQLENDPTLPPPQIPLVGIITYTDPRAPLPPAEQPEESERTTWSDVLWNNDLTAEAWDNTLSTFEETVKQWQAHQQRQQQLFQNQFNSDQTVIQNRMSYEQQGRSPYDLPPEKAHQIQLIAPVLAPKLLSQMFVDGVQQTANGMEKSKLASAYKSLKRHAGHANLRLSDLLKQDKAAKQAAAANPPKPVNPRTTTLGEVVGKGGEALAAMGEAAGEIVQDMATEKWETLSKQFEKEMLETAAMNKYYLQHPELWGEYIAHGTKKVLHNGTMNGVEILNAGLFDVLDTDAINRYTAEQLGVDPDSLITQINRPFYYGLGTVGSILLPVGAAFKGVHLGGKAIGGAIKGLNWTARAGQVINHIPAPAKKFLQDLSLAGLQGFVADPNMTHPIDWNDPKAVAERQRELAKDPIQRDKRLSNALGAVLIKGGTAGLDKIVEKLRNRFSKIWPMGADAPEPWTGDTKSSGFGYAGGRKRSSIGNSNSPAEVIRVKTAHAKGEVKDPLFQKPAELPSHLEIKGRPIDLPGDGRKVLTPPYSKNHYGSSWDVNIGKTVINEGGFMEVAPNYIREGLTKEGQHFVYSEKIVWQLEKRGWTMQKIQNLLDYGRRVEGGIDYRKVNKYSEYRTKQGSTVKFIDQDGYAIDFNIETHELIHVDTRSMPPDFVLR
jgi:hypothetical protein